MPNNYCVIDADSREITVPVAYRQLGVASDEQVNRIYFKCPKIVGDDIDLSTLNLYINYQNGNNEKRVYIVTDKAVEENNITFSWLLSRHVTEYSGTVSYTVCAKKSSGAYVVNEWNTKVATGNVSEGLKSDMLVLSEADDPDLVEQILASIDAKLENIDDDIEEACAETLADAKTYADTKQKELIDYSPTVINNAFVNAINGQILNGSYNPVNYAICDIPVTEGSTIALTLGTNPTTGNYRGLAFYRKDGTSYDNMNANVLYVADQKEYIVTVPKNAVTLSFTCFGASDSYTLETYSIASIVDDLNNTKTTPNREIIDTTTKFIDNAYYNVLGQTIMSNSGYYLVKKPVVPGATLYVSTGYAHAQGAIGFAFFTKEGSFINGVGYTSGTFDYSSVAPQNASYALITVSKNRLLSASISIGSKLITDNLSRLNSVVSDDSPLSKIKESPSFITMFRKIVCIGDSLTRGQFDTSYPFRVVSNNNTYFSTELPVESSDRINLYTNASCENDDLVLDKVLVISDNNYYVQTNGSNVSASIDTPGVDLGTDFSYPMQMAKMTGVSVTNCGIGGVTASKQTTWNWMDAMDDSRLFPATDFTTNPGDAYIIALGTNDIINPNTGNAFSGNVETDINDNDYTQNATTSVGGYAAIIQRILGMQAKAKIFCVTIPQTRNTAQTRAVANTKIKAIAQRFGCYVIDLETYAEGSQGDFATYYKNSSHNNALGYNLRARQYISYIDWIIEHNLEDFRNVAFIGTNYDFVRNS